MNGLTDADYEYVVQPIGTGIPTAAGTAAVSNPQPLTGLTASTVYEAYLRANCGGGDFSDWTKVDFGTECAPVGDFMENFDTFFCKFYVFLCKNFNGRLCRKCFFRKC